MIQNPEDSRVDQDSCYIMTRPVKIILFWCSFSSKRTKFFMLGGLKTLMECITKYGFFGDVEVRISRER
jgi:hypothetical protein